MGQYRVFIHVMRYKVRRYRLAHIIDSEYWLYYDVQDYRLSLFELIKPSHVALFEMAPNLGSQSAKV